MRCWRDREQRIPKRRTPGISRAPLSIFSNQSYFLLIWNWLKLRFPGRSDIEEMAPPRLYPAPFQNALLVVKWIGQSAEKRYRKLYAHVECSVNLRLLTGLATTLM